MQGFLSSRTSGSRRTLNAQCVTRLAARVAGYSAVNVLAHSCDAGVLFRVIATSCYMLDAWVVRSETPRFCKRHAVLACVHPGFETLKVFRLEPLLYSLHGGARLIRLTTADQDAHKQFKTCIVKYVVL